MCIRDSTIKAPKNINAETLQCLMHYPETNAEKTSVYVIKESKDQWVHLPLKLCEKLNIELDGDIIYCKEVK